MNLKKKKNKKIKKKKIEFVGHLPHKQPSFLFFFFHAPHHLLYTGGGNPRIPLWRFALRCGVSAGGGDGACGVKEKNLKQKPLGCVYHRLRQLRVDFKR
jgi:hypothetical protein